jgi:GT2 family glycosyltransferase
VSRVRNARVRRAAFGGTTACLYRTEVFRKVGLFDEFYFFYNEDLDLSLRVKRAGMRFVFDPAIRVVHHKNQGKAKGARFVRPHFYAADYYFYRKNYGIPFASVYLVMATAHYFLLRRKLHHKGKGDALLLLEQAWDKLRQTRNEL